MDYKIGDKVVYPNHGVGIVEQISYGVLNGRTERYFMIRIVSSGLRVMVPQSKRLETPLQGKLRAHAHRVPPRSRRRPQESRFPQPQQAPFLPRKENARTREVSSRQRNGYFTQYLSGKRRGYRREVSRQGQAAVPCHDRKIRIALAASAALPSPAGSLGCPLFRFHAPD